MSDDEQLQAIHAVMSHLQDMSEGPSLFAKTREGIVFKSEIALPRFSGSDGNSPFSFKAISNSYLLKHGDRG